MMARPEHCPHQDCNYEFSMAEDAFCYGMMQHPVEHDGVMNNCRVCLKQCDADVIDLQVNQGDLWWMERFFTRVFSSHMGRKYKGEQYEKKWGHLKLCIQSSLKLDDDTHYQKFAKDLLGLMDDIEQDLIAR